MTNLQICILCPNRIKSPAGSHLCGAITPPYPFALLAEAGNCPEKKHVGQTGFVPVEQLKVSAKPAPRPRPLPKPLPFDKWPPRLQKLASHAIPSDRGIGDIKERRYARFGGRWYKAFWKMVGKPCRCEDEQSWLNAKYPIPC